MTDTTPLTEIDEFVYEFPRTGSMRVPARVYGSPALIEEMQSPDDRTLEQLRNMATIPGIQRFAVVLPDGHQGYGFPIGGVAAVDAEDGVISPGGIGFDINCGVRVLRTDLSAATVTAVADDIADRLYDLVPAGLGKGGYVSTDRGDIREILEMGMDWMVEEGYATDADRTHCEEMGRLPGNPAAVPDAAIARGEDQVGSLGSGNHFLEVQRVVDIYDEQTATAFGLELDQVLVMIHSGSRGLGHQICTEYVRRFERAYPAVADSLPDRQLMYAPLGDDLAEKYRGAMNAAANFAWANRQAMTDAVRTVFREEFGTASVDLLYDVCHNIAKTELHEVDGIERDLLVHRKGATRSFPAGHPEVPAAYRNVGQPVLLPGSMGSYSYVLAGGKRSLDLTFGSTAHGAGRRMSRKQAKGTFRADSLRHGLRDEGIYVRARSGSTIAEEAPGAYKDIDEVVRVSDRLGIGGKVARMRPIATIKG